MVFSMKQKIKLTEIGRIPEDWNIAILRNICVQHNGIQTGPFGSQLHQKDYKSVGTPIITVEHLGENRIIHENIPYVSDDDKERLSRYTLKVGDIVFSRVGSVDRRVLVREAEDGWLFSGRCLRVRPNPNLVDSEYLSWFFGLPAFKEHIRKIAVGATMPSLNTELLSNVKVVLPPLVEQRSIASILGSLDDTIALNHSMNATLEAIGQALFKHWFVDFEFPNEEGKPYRSNGGEMVNEVPKGWKVGNLGEYVNVFKGCSYRSEDLQDSDKALVTLKAIERGGGFKLDGLKSYTGEYKDEQIISPGELVVAHTDLTQKAEVLGKPAIIRRVPIFSTLIASLDLSIVRPKNDSTNVPFVYFLLKTEDFQNHAYGYADGTTVLHLNKKAVPDYKFVLPQKDLVKKFGDIIIGLLNKIQNNELESEVLISIRNALLPKLMSGEIRMNVKREVKNETMG